MPRHRLRQSRARNYPPDLACPRATASPEAPSRIQFRGRIGAAFLCADLELTPDLRSDHASYIAHWLKVLKSDTRAIFTAASLAQLAADFLLGLQPTAQTGHELPERSTGTATA